jgi:tetratricopeptide (TPR) repeat protein
VSSAPLETSRICPRCGRAIPLDQSACSCVTRPRRLWLHSRETILLLTFAGLILAFIVTGSVSRLYHLRRRALATDWSARGASDLQASRAGAALVAFQTALIYAREDVSDAEMQLYELHLVDALIAGGHDDEARSYLLDLRSNEPGRGQLNLELARLAAKEGDDEAAKGYYDSAINGLWDGNAQQVANSRRAARLELYQYLTQRGEKAAAQSVLLAVAAALPADADLHAKVGQIMLDAGEAQLALEQFQEALRLDPHNNAALLGAGTTAFQLGDDRAAEHYLEQALRDRPSNDPRLQQSLAIAKAAGELDPFQTGLALPARASRAASSYQLATRRLTECASAEGISLTSSRNPAAGQGRTSPDLQKLYEQVQSMSAYAHEVALEREPGRIEALMNLVFAIEATVTNECGTPARAEDAALSRIAKRRAPAGAFTTTQGAHE